MPLSKREEERAQNVRDSSVKIGTRCKYYRTKADITIDEIAELSGYSKWTVYKFESNETNNATLLYTYIIVALTKGDGIFWLL